MIKRPLNERFSGPVLRGYKITTIRDKPWPIDRPIMLYNWSGAAYRSKQIDVAAVVVESTQPVVIHHREDGFLTVRTEQNVCLPSIWNWEGFTSKEDFDGWFKPLVKPGGVLHKHLMRFRLLNANVEGLPGSGGPQNPNPL